MWSWTRAFRLRAQRRSERNIFFFFFVEGKKDWIECVPPLKKKFRLLGSNFYFSRNFQQSIVFGIKIQSFVLVYFLYFLYQFQHPDTREYPLSFAIWVKPSVMFLRRNAIQ